MNRMPAWPLKTNLLAILFAGVSCAAQTYSGQAPDRTSAALISNGCVVSKYFGFSYLLPDGMLPQEIPASSRNDPSGEDFVLFMATRTRKLPDFNHDVLDAAAEYRAGGRDAGAAGFLRALKKANEAEPDIESQGDVHLTTLNNQEFANLLYKQRRDDGTITYESAYAIALRGYVVYFVFASISANDLAGLERSMQSFRPGSACPTTH